MFLASLVMETGFPFVARSCVTGPNVPVPGSSQPPAPPPLPVVAPGPVQAAVWTPESVLPDCAAWKPTASHRLGGWLGSPQCALTVLSFPGSTSPVAMAAPSPAIPTPPTMNPERRQGLIGRSGGGAGGGG